MRNFDYYFEIVKFATPETNVRLRTENLPKTRELILARCMTWQDIMHLISADFILTRNEIFVKWFIPYKPFARQDRITNVKHADESFLLKKIFTSCDKYDLHDRIVFLDVHSNEHKFGRNINQTTPILHYKLFTCGYPGEHKDLQQSCIVIAPDAGANKKISNLTTFWENRYSCDKVRDPVTGALTEFSVPYIKCENIKNLVICDDICDGGGTFNGIAKYLQQYRSKESGVNLILYVTHGLFTKGLDQLLENFDYIITTNSIEQKIENSRLIVLDVLCEEFLKRNIL